MTHQGVWRCHPSLWRSPSSIRPQSNSVHSQQSPHPICAWKHWCVNIFKLDIVNSESTVRSTMYQSIVKSKACTKRHPKGCKFFTAHNFCKYNDKCAYMHTVTKEKKWYKWTPEQGWTSGRHSQSHVWKSNGSWKNPAYGRQSISRPMRIVAPIPKKSC